MRNHTKLVIKEVKKWFNHNFHTAVSQNLCIDVVYMESSELEKFVSAFNILNIAVTLPQECYLKINTLFCKKIYE